MTKYAFVLHHNDLNLFLEQLQKLGVVDVERHNAQLDDKANGLFQESERYASVYRQLKKIKINKDAKVEPYVGTAKEMLTAYENVIIEHDQLSGKIKRLEKDIQEAEPWGNFDINILDKIEGLGLTPRFYCVFEKSYRKEWEKEYAISIISKLNGKVYFVLLQHIGEILEFDQQEIKFPSASSADSNSELIKSQKHLDEINHLLNQMSLSANILKAEKDNLMKAFDFRVANLNATRKAEGTVAIVTGWIPDEQNESLVAFLDGQGTIYLSEKPTTEDNPPILLKNSSFSKPFEAISNLYSLPNYHEIDLTPFMAPFFMLFFGLCFGDGGYGVLVLVLCTLLKLKVKGEYRFVLSIGQWFGLATVIVSLFTGSVFGMTIDKLNILGGKGLVERQFGLNENYGMLSLSIIIGAIQVLFGMCLNAAKITLQRGFKYALSSIAWVVLIVTAVIFGIIGSKIGAGVYILYAIMGLSLLIALFYNNPGKNILVNFGGGIWNTYNIVAGLLGDLLSYIRLFALGFTGGVLGMVFNKLAFSVDLDIPIVGAIITGLILIIGHSLNIMLSTIGALVHPLRLTFVEFYKNAGFEGGGKKYNPLK